MMAATMAKGDTLIENAAREPEIVDLANFINKLGGDVRGAGTSNIRVRGVEKLYGTNHSIIPDRIEAATFMIGAAMTRGKVRVQNLIPSHLVPITAKLREAGAVVVEDGDAMIVSATKRPVATNIKTMPYPGFPTDAQSQFMAMMAISEGESRLVETVFENRFMHVAELVRMGANIETYGKEAVVRGVPLLFGAEVRATDLRAGAALVLTGLVAEGTTTLTEIAHLDRGYDRIEEKSRLLAATFVASSTRNRLRRKERPWISYAEPSASTSAHTKLPRICADEALFLRSRASLPLIRIRIKSSPPAPKHRRCSDEHPAMSSR